MLPIRRRISFVLVAVVALLPPSRRGVIAQVTQPSSGPAELRFGGASTQPAELKQLLVAVDAELRTLPVATQPAVGPSAALPTTRPDAEPGLQVEGWRLELSESLREFKRRLVEYEGLERALEAPDGAARFAEEIAELKQKTQELRGRSPPDQVTDEAVAEAA